jgi:hypothetical protein
MASLLELQRAFARTLREADADCAVQPLRNLSIYRNNVAAAFHNALAIAFPVLRARVGDDYFRQLAHHYRVDNPSRSGDLHWVGRHFAPFLDEHLRGSDYAWLAELARLEWSCEEASITQELPALPVEALASVAPDDLGDLRITLQPSVRPHAFPFPLFALWRANQGVIGAPVDQSLGNEQGLVRMRGSQVECISMPADQFAFISALADGQTLGEAVEIAAVEGERLLPFLRFLFAEELVVGIGLRT